MAVSEFTYGRGLGGFPLLRNFYVRWHIVNKGKTIYGRSRFNVKGYLRSTIVFTRGLSYIASILFARVKIT